MRPLFLASILACNVAAAANAEALWHAAYFTDNGDRQALSDLRATDTSLLDETGRVILQAADRIGFIFLPDCKKGANAVLINIEGRDAVVTAGHLVIDLDRPMINMKLAYKCKADTPARYYMNMGYYDATNGVPSVGSFERQFVELHPFPLNYAELESSGSPGFRGNRMDTEPDFLVYFLQENVSDDVMPGGHVRGFMQWSKEFKRKGSAFIIGFDGRWDEERPRQMSWQECAFRQSSTVLGVFYHTCDTSPGSSGSLLGTIEDGQMTLQAINVSGEETYDTPTPRAPSDMNQGVSAHLIQRRINLE